ncbi:bifunctional 2-polyprenyl-6-hydroxyphenol methylase/3-demethylubiquinol 3-O-methyltransferase UbiG [Streptomyces sp. SMS_SU21]|uniref:class I SAM-dependent methyltransferase n=1 Tax=Streptomyces sp. SMS_SU21 TaxID=2069440 RepID=UPI001CDA18D1|nr:class I SAM-dependent methyltransferase [Streptomyces sp. SMS_SU21]MCA2201216.1 methyltransferase domain-containing protein [Streptomyces sp. SMS_SU21]
MSFDGEEDSDREEDEVRTMDAADWDERYRGSELVWRAEPNRFVEQALAGLEPAGRAVDIAAGEGRNAVWLAERGWEVDAVDFSEVALGKAARLAAERGVPVRTVQADLMDWAPPAASYDLALIAYLQVPWPQLAEVLSRAATAVRTGGTLLLVGHDAANLEHGHGGPRDPGVLYTAEQVAGVWRPYADIVRAETVTRPVTDAEGRGRTALDALVRAVRR